MPTLLFARNQWNRGRFWRNRPQLVVAHERPRGCRRTVDLRRSWGALGFVHAFEASFVNVRPGSVRAKCPSPTTKTAIIQGLDDRERHREDQKRLGINASVVDDLP
jgi:hypothetical protein